MLASALLAARPDGSRAFCTLLMRHIDALSTPESAPARHKTWALPLWHSEQRQITPRERKDAASAQSSEATDIVPQRSD